MLGFKLQGLLLALFIFTIITSVYGIITFVCRQTARQVHQDTRAPAIRPLANLHRSSNSSYKFTF
jgi:hypothetical protein